MPWVRARLRGQLVYARATSSGELLRSGGRVEIRYKPGDGRAYHASASNLQIAEPKLLPDDAVGEAKPAEPKPARPKAARSKTARAPAPDGPPIDHGDAAIAYTDGACTGNPGPAGLGVIVKGGGKTVELSEYLGIGTNNIAELTAIQRALEMTDGPVVIHTDSQYAIGILSKGWKAKLNKELVAEIRELLSGRPEARFVYVPGHAGVPLNERADELARLAITTRQTRRQEV